MSQWSTHRGLVRRDIPLNAITLTGAGATYTRDAANQFSISLPTAATTYRLGVPLSALAQYRSTPETSPNLYGLEIKNIVLWLSIGAVDLTSHTFTIGRESIAGAAARAAATAVGGTLTYDTDDGAATILPVTQRANLYKVVVTLPTAISQDNDLELTTAEWTLATGAATGTAKVHGVQIRGAFGVWG